MPTRDLATNENGIFKALDAGITTTERQVLGNYRTALDKIRVEMSKVYEKFAVDGKLTLAQMTQYNRKKALEKRLVEILREANVATGTDIKLLTTAQYQGSFFRHAWAIDQNTGIALSWGTMNESAVRAAVKNPLDKIAQKRLRKNSLAKIKSTVTQGLIRGQSYPKMMQGIKNSINGTAAAATQIVRTEGQRAQVLGQEAVYGLAEEQGVEGRRIWDATLDARTRPDHGALDGVPEKRGVDGEHLGWTFPDGVHTSGPLQSGVAKQDVNCRCRERFEIVGLEPELRRTRDGGVQPYQTYSEWKPA